MLSERMKHGWCAAIAACWVIAAALPAAAQAQEPPASQHAFLGADLRDLTRQEAATLGLKLPHGTAVKKVEANSPAAAAGLKRGDIVVEINGKSVADTGQFLKVIASKTPGTVVTVRLLRDGRLRAGPVKLGVKPAEALAASMPHPEKAPEPVRPQQEAPAADDLAALDAQAGELHREGKYTEAAALAERYVSLARQRHGEEHKAFAAAIGWQGYLYKELGRYAEAEPLLKRALEMRERLLGREHPDTLTSVNNLGELYLEQEHTAEAEPLLLGALEARERTLGKEHPDTLESVNNLGLLYKLQGKLEEAEPLILRALEARERTLGKEHPDTLTSVNDLATLYDNLKRYHEAEPLYKRALEARERVLGKEHPDTLTSVNNLAFLYQGQGRYGEAEPLYKRALEARERVLGKDHPDTLASVNDLAEQYSNQRRYDEAEPLLKRVLEARERTLGKDHQDTLESVNNLATRYFRQGRYGEAEPLLKRVFEANERVHGKEHPSTLASLSLLALHYQVQGRYDEAEPLFRRLLETRERQLGKEHPDTLDSVDNLAALYYSQGRYGEAEPLHRRALEVRERVLGKEHPDTLDSVSNLANAYQAQGRYGEAEPLFKRALEARERLQGKEDTDTLICAGRLASLYQAQGRYGEAEPLFLRAVEGYEQGKGKEHPSTLLSINSLAQLYVDQGRYGDAEPLYRRVLDAQERTFGREHPNTLTSVNNLANLYLGQGRYGEAEPLYRRALEARERTLGREHPHTLDSVNNLANLYGNQGRYSEAEPLFRHVLEARERTQGKEHPNTLLSVNNLAWISVAQGRYGEAERLYRRALEGHERALGKEHPSTLLSVNNLAQLYVVQGRYGEAELLYRRALEARERTLGREHPATLTSVSSLANLYLSQGRYGEAEPLLRRALEARERSLGREHPDTLFSINSLANLYLSQGRYGDAEPLYRRVLDAQERTLGREHPATLTSVSNLAQLYVVQGRYGEAELLYRRALEARERTLGREHPHTLASVNNLAWLYKTQGRYGEAEPLLLRALEARERVLGKDHPDTLDSVNDLALLYLDRGRYGDAEPLLKRAQEGHERVLGKEHPSTLMNVNNLAWLYQAQGRYGEAEPLLLHAIEARERVLGKEHPDTLMSVSNLASLHYAKGDWARAVQVWQRSTGAIARHTLRGWQDEALSGKKKEETERNSWQFSGLVRAAYRLSPEGQAPDAALTREMFQNAQWALSSEAAQSLAQMAARGAKGDPQLAPLVRERQDLLAEWQKRDGLRNAALGQAPEKRDAKAEAENLTRLAILDARAGEIDAILKEKFPDYAALASPAPLSIEEVQAQLGADEALVLFVDTPEWKPAPEETFIWVVTKTDARWLRSAKGKAALTSEVQALRCGLDAVAWAGQGAAQCSKLLNIPADQAPEEDGLLPFDLAHAHALYQALFAGAEDLIKGKSLIVVPSGALTQLPFQVLVTALPDNVPSGEQRREAGLLGAQIKNLTAEERQSLNLSAGRGVRIVKPAPGGAAEAAGLQPDDILLSMDGEDFATVQKVVDATRARAPGTKLQLRVLRGGSELEVTATLGGQTLREWIPRLLAKADGKTVAWLIRDHALTVLPAVSSLKALRRVARPSAASKPMIGFGNPLLDGPDGRYAALAKRARGNQACTAPAALQLAQASGLPSGIAQIETRGGFADVAFLRKAPPLPETADELCAVARDLHADLSEIRLGGRATEREVKALSASGQLAQYRIVHFATHGALAGQVTGNSEPGLLLTPPDAPSDEDDGYLTASEIAALKLDADWVILSACNTAAGGAQGAEALSGLARAFIYAQARALLVSHWEVDSAATVKLITSAVDAMSRDPRVGRAQALRSAMLELIDKGEPYEAHPAYWAPFVVVGEGGR